MLDALTKFGGYRIDHFEPNCSNASAFALYVRGGLVPGSLYSLEAKQQLYFGLALIQSVLGLEKLAGVFVDVNDLANLERPAYRELKREILAGEIKRVLILDPSAILGNPVADRDVAELFQRVNRLEIFTVIAGVERPIVVEPALIPLAI
jgi:hypothetical protein